MKEILLVCGFGGAIMLIVLTISRWGVTQKLKGISGATTRPNVNFLWKFTAVLLLISIVLAVKPEIVTVPWERNKTATALTMVLLLGLLIQWAVQSRKGDHPTGGESGTSSLSGSLFGVLVACLLLSATYSCFQAGARHQAERGLLATQGWREPQRGRPLRVVDFPTNMVLEAGQLSWPISVDGTQSCRWGPRTVSNAEVRVLRYYKNGNSLVTVVTNQFWADVTSVTGFELRFQSIRASGSVMVEVTVGRM